MNVQQFNVYIRLGLSLILGSYKKLLENTVKCSFHQYTPYCSQEA